MAVWLPPPVLKTGLSRPALAPYLRYHRQSSGQVWYRYVIGLSKTQPLRLFGTGFPALIYFSLVVNQGTQMSSTAGLCGSLKTIWMAKLIIFRRTKALMSPSTVTSARLRPETGRRAPGRFEAYIKP